jgi:hypothetical protein
MVPFRPAGGPVGIRDIVPSHGRSADDARRGRPNDDNPTFHLRGFFADPVATLTRANRGSPLSPVRFAIALIWINLGSPDGPDRITPSPDVTLTYQENSAHRAGFRELSRQQNASATSRRRFQAGEA